MHDRETGYTRKTQEDLRDFGFRSDSGLALRAREIFADVLDADLQVALLTAEVAEEPGLLRDETVRAGCLLRRGALTSRCICSYLYADSSPLPSVEKKMQRPSQ